MALAPEIAAFFEAPNFAALATIRADGTPHVSPVWIDYDGENVVFNTSAGRAKWKHLQRDPRATLQVSNPENPYEYVEVTGSAVLSQDGADEHIDKLAKKYMGVDSYPYRTAEEVRVIVRVAPSKVTHFKAG